MPSQAPKSAIVLPSRLPGDGTLCRTLCQAQIRTLDLLGDPSRQLPPTTARLAPTPPQAFRQDSASAGPRQWKAATFYIFGSSGGRRPPPSFLFAGSPCIVFLVIFCVLLLAPCVPPGMVHRQHASTKPVAAPLRVLPQSSALGCCCCPTPSQSSAMLCQIRPHSWARSSIASCCWSLQAPSPKA